MNTWAPDVSVHGSTYFMYFAASGPDNMMCIAVATSQNPLGPFKDAIGKPLVCSEPANAFADIDPKSWDDPATGKIYLCAFAMDCIICVVCSCILAARSAGSLARMACHFACKSWTHLELRLRRVAASCLWYLYPAPRMKPWWKVPGCSLALAACFCTILATIAAVPQRIMLVCWVVVACAFLCFSGADDMSSFLYSTYWY